MGPRRPCRTPRNSAACKEGERRQRPAQDVAAPPPSSISASPHEPGSEPQGAGRTREGLQEAEGQTPGVPFPFCHLSLPHGGSTHKASLSHGGKHLKCPEKNPPLSGELGHWPLCPKGLGGGGILLFFFFPLAICPENHPVLCNFGRRGLDLRLSRTRTFQPKN